MEIRITRRALGLAAAGAAALAHAQEQTKDVSNYRGPLDGVADKLNPSDFDTVTFSRRLYERAPLKLTFRAEDRKAAELWQKRLRAKIVELVGGFPDRGKAPEAEILETREFPSYTREKFVFE